MSREFEDLEQLADVAAAAELIVAMRAPAAASVDSVSQPSSFASMIKGSADAATTTTDHRGIHWRAKVEQGNAPEPWKGNKLWSHHCKVLETAYEEIICLRGIPNALPWKEPGAGRTTGNTMKALLMQLLVCELNGYITLTRNSSASLRGGDGKAFFGIMEVFVPAKSIPAFDACPVPTSSWATKAEAIFASGGSVPIRKKALVKIWETAGFVERKGSDGSVFFVFDSKTFTKQRTQQSAIRKRSREVAQRASSSNDDES